MEPDDVIRMWREALAKMSGDPELARQFLAPAEIFEQAWHEQSNTQRQFLAELVAPFRTLVEMLEQTSVSLRGQAELLGQQAALVEQAAREMKRPLDLLGVSPSPAAPPSAREPEERL